MIINALLLPLIARISKYVQICQLFLSMCFYKCFFLVVVLYRRDVFP